VLYLEPNNILRQLAFRLNITGALVAAILVLGGAWLVLGPLTRDTAEISSRLDIFHEMLRDEGHLRAEHVKLCQQLDVARRQDAALRKRIPEGPQEADFLLHVSRAATEAGLQITDYRPGVVTAGKSCSALRVEMSCEGNYRSICSLLDRLRELPRHCTVACLEIDAAAVPDKYLAKLGLELYFFGGRQLAEGQARP
jgi:Tfp pilus assembly protein PilO